MGRIGFVSEKFYVSNCLGQDVALSGVWQDVLK